MWSCEKCDVKNNDELAVCQNCMALASHPKTLKDESMEEIPVDEEILYELKEQAKVLNTVSSRVGFLYYWLIISLIIAILGVLFFSRSLLMG